MNNKVVIKLVLDAQLRAELKARAALEKRTLNSSILWHLEDKMTRSVPKEVRPNPFEVKLDPKVKAEMDAFQDAEEGSEHP